jgi:L-threonylcarbamoyladenylate synthase
LIVHIDKPDAAIKLVQLSAEELKVFNALSNKFWPGPLTMITRSSPLIPTAVTANTGTVGIRCPAHPIAQRLLSASGLPIAAPSANRFGHVSPTKAMHVIADLGAKGVKVINGESNSTNDDDTCQYGRIRVYITTS